MDKPLVCVECGKPPPKDSKLNKNGLCLQCAIGHILKSAKQLHAKKGEYYDRWKRGMKLAAKRL